MMNYPINNDGGHLRTASRGNTLDALLISHLNDFAVGRTDGALVPDR